MKDRYVLVTGYAKAPKGTSMFEIYKHAGIVLKIDRTNDTIVDCEATVVTQLAREFLKELCVGYDLKNGVDGLLNDVRRYYLAPSQEAFIVAIRAATQRYFDDMRCPDATKSKMGVNPGRRTTVSEE